MQGMGSTNQPETKFFHCSCYGEGVAVTHDGDTIDLAFWQFSHRNRLTLSARIRHILHIIFKGTPFTDMVVLSPKEALNLGRYLLRTAETSTVEIGGSGDDGGHRLTEVHDTVPGQHSQT